MKECEVKILGIDVKKVVDDLLAAGAHCVFSGEMEVYYFDYEDGRIKNSNELCRLRRLGNKVELVYKKNLKEVNGFKVADEYQVEVSDLENAKTIFLSLGMKISKKYFKKRQHFVIGEATFVIDEHPDLEPYLEIEADTEHGIEEWILDLGLGEFERSTKTFDDLLEGKK